MDTHYPSEYTRWWVEFYYQKFQVNEHVLIPRFETEDLVREIIKVAGNTSFDTLIDVGTGSGIIPVSILTKVAIEQSFGLDISPKALEVAKTNAKNINVKNIEFFISDLLSVFLSPTSVILGKNILITANLPYIKDGDWENMSEDTQYEPKIALFGGSRTGFELYEKLFSQIPDFLEKHRPERLMILAEMGEDQEEIATKTLESLAQKMNENKIKVNFSFFADCFGIRRFIKIEIL